MGNWSKHITWQNNISQFSNLTSNMENSVLKIWFKMKSIAIEGKCFFCSQNHFREHWHTINSSLFINIFLMCWKKIWRIIDIKEGSCNIIYEINLSGMSIQQRHGFSKATNWVVIHYILSQKNQNFRQPKLDNSSRQIYWVISYHQYNIKK